MSKIIKEFEIFKAGKYGESESRVWTDEEVRQLKDNYDYNFRRSPIKLGHDGFFDSERPAVGWVKELKINDNGVLVAVGEFNKKDVEEIKDRYINVSVEVTKSIQSYDIETDKTGAYLLGVALLGSSQPAVAGLKPLEFSKSDDKNEFIQTNINFENESFSMLGENDNITQNRQGDNEMEKLEEFKKENEKLIAELEKYKKQTKRNEFEKFMNENQDKIIPAVKEELTEFAMDLNDTQLEKFKSIIEKMPKLDLFKTMDGEEPEPKNKVSAVEEALKDLEQFKKVKGV